MNRNERGTLVVLAGVLLLGALLWMTLRSCARSTPASLPIVPMPSAVSPSTATPTVTPLAATPDSMTVHVASSAAPTPASERRPSKRVPPPGTPASGPKTTSTGAPIPPTLELHKELIPKDITIIRFHADQEIVPPSTSVGFDINGSGFNQEFERMITVESGEAGIHVRNLHLVTVNQIHGEMDIDADAQTAFVFPRVLIRGLPVFRAEDPYAVIRKGEVLTIIFISMEDNGRAGRFRVLTHLDNALLGQFHIVPSTGGLEISDIVPRLPYAVEGTLRIGQRVPPGEYGLVIQIGDKTAFRRDGMIRIVRPNVGSTGFVQAMIATEPYRRPGDLLQLYVYGSGFIPENIKDLRAQVNGFDMGLGSFTFLNGGQMRLTFQVPQNAPASSYGVSILNGEGQTLCEKKDVFQIVPENWIGGVRVTPPVKAGGQSTLKVVGRDLSPEFMKSIKIDLDIESGDTGIRISPLTYVDASTLSAEIVVNKGVAPGDYWLHLSAGGKKISPPSGTIIKVEAP